MSPQLSCGDTCQISTWCHTGNQCFDHWEKIGKIMEQRNWLSDPLPWCKQGQSVSEASWSWLHDLLEMLSILLSHYMGNTLVTSGFPSQSPGNAFHIIGPLYGEYTSHQLIPNHKGHAMWTFDISLEVSLIKLLNKQLICQWFEAP